MSFIFRDRNDDDYLIDIPWMEKEEIEKVADSLVLRNMLAAIASKCVEVDENV